MCKANKERPGGLQRDGQKRKTVERIKRYLDIKIRIDYNGEGALVFIEPAV